MLERSDQQSGVTDMRVLSVGIAVAVLAGLAPSLAKAQETPATTVEDIVVLGMPLREQVETFVDDVTAPATGWGPARWDERWGICVGVVNLRGDVAQAMADRISEVALDLNLTVGEPGCSPNVLVIATDDAPALAAAMVERSPNAFRPRYSGAARPASQLEIFQTRDSPVRWWHVSMPTDSETGTRATRLPGDYVGSYDRAIDVLGYAPQVSVSVASRIQSSIEDTMKRSFVIIDVDRLGGVSLEQLGDYVAMVALVQVNPDADTGRYETILNLFEQPDSIAGLSGWDRAYMEGIYATRPGRISTMAQVQSITQAILSAYRGQQEEE